MKFTIFHNENNLSIVSRIRTVLVQYGYIEENDNPDIVISVGGDGTFLRAVEYFHKTNNDILFVGVKAGRLGFYCDFSENDIESLPEIIKLKENILHLDLVKGTIDDKETFFALNEISITSIPNTIYLEIFVDNSSLEKYAGTGIIFSTTSGSTAYNKSLKGAIVDSVIPTIQMTKMAAVNSSAHHSLDVSLILNNNRKILVKSLQKLDYLISFDNKILKTTMFDKLDISLKTGVVKTLVIHNDVFVRRLKKAAYI